MPESTPTPGKRREPSGSSPTIQTSERFNSATHLVGAVAAVIGTAVLIVTAARDGDPWKLAGFAIYGLSLVLLYSSSTLYHAAQGSWKKIFQKLDHLAIYVLIAGSYTPFLLVPLRDSVGWPVFTVVWTLAAAGMLIEFLPGDKRRVLPLILYLGMGWLAISISGPMLESLTAAGFAWVVAGGLLYTGGVVFYALDHRHRYAHGVWHLFVLAGSASHFIAVIGFV